MRLFRKRGPKRPKTHLRIESAEGQLIFPTHLPKVADLQAQPCTDCDGRGYYMGWPHTTCPTCGGSGTSEPGAAGLREGQEKGSDESSA